MVPSIPTGTGSPSSSSTRTSTPGSGRPTETGRAGGAYSKDLNGDSIPDWVPVNDPRVFQEGRNVRMGVSVAF